MNVFLQRFFRMGSMLLGGLLILISSAWAFGALWYDGPSDVIAIAYLLVALTLLILFTSGRRIAGFGAAGLVALVTLWWFSLQPRNDRDWQGDVAREPWAEVNGDLVTIHNVRNFDYRPDNRSGEKDPRWETRTVRLSQLTGIDAFLNFWGVSWMAHPILSFQFKDTPPIAVSVETRKEKGEDYSALGGLYRQYELIYVVADERDVIRLRSNYRDGEEVYLYRTTMPPAEVRERFLEYIRSMNELHAHPRWYNAITANCTTTIRSQRSIAARSPWDLRILKNGHIDEMFYQRGLLSTGGLPFGELKQRALINSAAMAADQDPEFSRRIRAGRPGFDD
ncbi:MAG: DUF4105 domain-containing protein [Chthoniobacterales bacterium]